MGAIPSISSSIGNQSPIPPSVNNNAASNPVSNLSTQKNLAEANNAGTAASNTAATGQSSLKGIITNLNLNLSPQNKV